ncbi:MAG TPA: peptidyl-dipeptidase Dcp [Woeseiaceae bacterium]|nr:peptidyl-dipeptidase Dcp [Woeseiaceae bacterium]
MQFTRLFLLLAVLGLTGCSEPSADPVENGAGSADTAAAASGENPFFTVSPLPYHAPQFDLIENEDFQPAIEEGMRRQIEEVEAIASNDEPPTFANTIEAMERSGALLSRTMQVFSAVVQANTNDTLQQVQKEMAPKLAAHRDAIYLNGALFERVDTLYQQRDELDLAPEQRRLLDEVHTDFIRSGAQLSAADKETLKELNQQESKLTTEFQNRLLEGTKAGAVVVDDVAMLEGMSEAEIAAAKQAAEARGLKDKWLLPLQNTTQQPALDSLANRDLRRRLLAASEHRTDQGGPNDTRELIQQLVQIRANQARLLGFPTYADYVLVERMAKTPENAIELMTDIVPAATAKARAEAARMQEIIDAEGKDFELTAYDWGYYAEKVRKAEYDLDESQIKPYFELNRVLEDGVFYAANQLYGLTFKERDDLPVYHPDVRVFEVFDADGEPLALFYADYFKRDNKSGGAWMSAFVSQSGLLDTKPVVYNVANFTKPAPGKPALLTYDNVETMFHEFGHALHGMFSDVKYPTLAGTNVPRDFVEFPSQFNEHWALEPEVLAHYAKHYETGEPMPQSLVDKIQKSRTFNQGYDTTEYLAAALVDMAWHTLPSDAPTQNVEEFEDAALARYHVDLDTVPPRYHSTYFSHIFDSGYAAGYYSYLWSEVLDHDAYYWFEDHGGLTRENGQRFRDMILSRGNTEDPAAMYREFAGHDPSVEPLLIERGLKNVGVGST